MIFVDWLMVGAIVLSIAVAAAQGFAFEVFSLAGVIVGYLVAAWEYPRVAARYAPFVKADWISNAAGFFTIFIAIVLLAGILAKLVHWTLYQAGLRWFDRLLGAVFGLLRGVLLVTVVVVAASSWVPTAPWLARSQIAPYLLIVGRAAVWLAPRQVRTQFREGLKQVRQLRPPEGRSVK